MGRRRTRIPLNVLLNNRLVGRLIRTPSAGLEFRYDPDWLAWEHTLPISLSLPLREDAYSGDPVRAVFENLLPDSDALLKRVAERVGASGTDAYSLLAAIGRDCVGALQFLPDEGMADLPTGLAEPSGTPVDEAGIAHILRNLGRAPLGLEPDDAFRISVAGAQEKTALLLRDGQWHKPSGTTPTTHIFKPQIGQLPNGIDLSNSVENEFFCLRLLEAMGLPVNKAEIMTFDDMKTLVVERFDRRWTKDGRLIRLPQEDCCQALSVPPDRKYQSQGGPGLVDLLKLLAGSDAPQDNRETVFKAAVLFWLIGATDGHAKNFSLFLNPGGGYRLTPLYDVLTAQPSLDARQIERKHMRLAMSVGRSNHTRFETVFGRHFVETALAGGLAKAQALSAIDTLCETLPAVLDTVSVSLPAGFPDAIVTSVRQAALSRRDTLTRTLEAKA